MLYILGEIPLPETTGEPWLIHKLSRTRSANRHKMKFWLGRIARKRKELCRQEGKSPVGLAEVQSLVAQMLHVEARLRVKAAELQVKAVTIELE